MLSTAYPQILLAILCLGSLIVSFACVIVVRSARSYCHMCYQTMEAARKVREPKSQFAQLSVEVTELTDAYQSLMESHKKLRSRIGMRELRDRKTSENGDNGLNSSDKRTVRLAAKAANLLK